MHEVGLSGRNVLASWQTSSLRTQTINKTTKTMTTKNIVFGRDEIETYDLIKAIIHRREREQIKRERILRVKRLALSLFAKLGLKGGSHE
jgi:hypothetical protein